MLSLRAAAVLLADRSALAPAALCTAVGLDGPPLPLDDASLRSLGLDAEVASAHIVRGTGALRALVVECGAVRPLRDVVRRVAARLGARAPHQLWLLVARDGCSGEMAVAAWSADRTPPRVAALVVHPDRPVASDAETLSALAAADAGADGDVLVHARWLEILGRDALTRRFYRALERAVGALARTAAGRATMDERREIALLATSRILFLSYLQAKGWLDGDHDFLARVVTRRLADGGDVHRRVLLPLFFGTLNTPPRRRAALARGFGRIPFLNGGLFTPTALERRRRDVRFADDAIGALFDDVLHRHRFTAREAAADWAETAVDPVMLGRAFESLMCAAERRGSGAFYTPQPIVEHLAEAALREALGEMLDEAGGALLAGDTVGPARRARLLARLDALRVLDPACGSGAFLVHVLERLAGLRATAGDDRPLAARRRTVLARSVFGVDVNPTAVWLCELRLWLSVAVEDAESDPLRVAPLPNLDRNIRVGDALSGEVRAGALGACRAVARLRERYARAAGPAKHGIARALDAAERRRALDALDRELDSVAAARRDLALVRRGRDLFGERHREAPTEERASVLRARARELRRRARALRDGAALPFAWHSHFADAIADGGFHVVLGNPPWVRLHRIPESARTALRETFAVFRGAAWRDGCASPRGGAGFGAQADLAALFVERGLALTRPGAFLAFLLPAKLWRSLAGGGVRAHLLAESTPIRLEDWSGAPAAFDAAVYPSMLLARRRAPERSAAPGVGAEAGTSGPRVVEVVVRRGPAARQWRLRPEHLSLDATPGSPWLLLPPEARAAFDRVADAGVALAAGPLGAPLLGVKSGCNEAFVLRVADGGGDLVARVRGGGRDGLVESALLRPLLRGESIRAWRTEPDGERVLWTHGIDRRPLERLPPHAARWLAPWRPRLLARSDGRGRSRWWALFRPDAADSARARVVWADIARSPAAAVLDAGDASVPLNSCYVLPCASRVDACAVAALLNGPLAASWLRVLAEPARGGYSRFLAWTVGRLPLPRDWSRARLLLAPLGERGTAGDPPGEAELLASALDAYDLRPGDVEALLAWSPG